MLYRQLYSWATTNTLLLFYTTCIRPHLEYACQLWDPYTSKSWLSLEAVQKFACKVCLKMWDLDYNTMLQLLNLPPLSVRREYLKLTAMYNNYSKWLFTTLLEYLCKVINVTTLVNQLMLILRDLMHVPTTCTIPLFQMLFMHGIIFHINFY